jgi:hypothetical protein
MTGDTAKSIGFRSAEGEALGTSRSETLNSEISRFDDRSGGVHPTESEVRDSTTSAAVDKLLVKKPKIVADKLRQLVFTIDRLHPFEKKYSSGF